MGTQTQDASEYYIWRIEGKPVVVHLHLDVVDRLLNDVMRGFGSVPKRGVELGGVLVGTIEHGDVTIVRVEDFEPVECEHQQGPSYVLSPADEALYALACRRWQPDESRPAYAVGFYRSQTHEGFSLTEGDVGLMDRYFPSPSHIALLIKPYATRTSTAGFFFREDGKFQESTLLEFPLRRRDLAGEEAPPPRVSQRERGRSDRPERARLEPELAESVAASPMTLPSRSRMRSAVWIPLSFVFLLFGVALGLMIALARGPIQVHGDATDFSLGLSIVKADENLSVKWDREASAVRSADHGVLEIEDGTSTKPVELDAAQLKNGSIIYRNSANSVRFRLIVYPKAHVSVTETIEWKQ